MIRTTGVEDLPDTIEEVPLFAAELVGGVLLVLLALGSALLLYLLLRRRRLAASAPSLSCALRPNGKGRWRSSFVRLGTQSLDCFAVFRLGLRPLRNWSRGEVEISTPGEPGGFIPGLSDPVVLELSSPATAEVFQLAIERSAYPALRSWTESGPPRPNSVV